MTKKQQPTWGFMQVGLDKLSFSKPSCRQAGQQQPWRTEFHFAQAV
jgi:hypothetical protein